MMKKYSVFILTAGTLWGLMGLFVDLLAGVGVSSSGAVMLRCGVAAVCFGATILLRDRGLFKVRLKDIWCFIGAGLCALLFFSYCYFRCMAIVGVSVAAILLYTAPSMVIIMSLFIFREKLTANKLIAVIMAFVGCCLVSGLGTGNSLSATGILLGLGAGFGYALYSIFAKLALDKGYNSMTVNFYACLLAAVGAGIIWGPSESLTAMFDSGKSVIVCVTAGIVTCYLPYLLYTYGLTGLETGKASIMASVEPVVATFVGVFIFGEKLTVMTAAGIVLVLMAIVLLNVRLHPRVKASHQTT